MKIKLIFVVSLTFYISVSPVFTQENNKDKENIPILNGPYIGQNLPEKTPVIFASGIVSTDYHDALYGFMNNGTVCIFDHKSIK